MKETEKTTDSSIIKAVELTAQIDENGTLLTEPLPSSLRGLKKLKLIVLYPDEQKYLEVSVNIADQS